MLVPRSSIGSGALRALPYSTIARISQTVELHSPMKFLTRQAGINPYLSYYTIFGGPHVKILKSTGSVSSRYFQLNKPLHPQPSLIPTRYNL